jgi:hypothetical protein
MPFRPSGVIFTCALFVAIVARPSASQDQRPAAAPTPQPDVRELRFSGEATRGQPFTRDIGHNLFFRLTPATSAAIATPPYHAYNDRYIAAAFGYSAKEALQAPLRKFNFVQSVGDEQRASEVVNAVLYPSTIGETEHARVAAESTELQLGTGQLRILHFKIVSGKDGAPDLIAWIKFEVQLDFSPGLTLQQVLAPHPPAPKR